MRPGLLVGVIPVAVLTVLMVLQPSAAIQYKVRVQTKSFPRVELDGAGTDSDVYFGVLGRGGTGLTTVTEMEALETEGHNDFEEGSIDVFIHTGADVGEIYGIRYHFPQHRYDKWWWVWTTVEDLSRPTGNKAVFVYDKWMVRYMVRPYVSYWVCGTHYHGKKCATPCYCQPGCGKCEGKCLTGYTGAYCDTKDGTGDWINTRLPKSASKYTDGADRPRLGSLWLLIGAIIFSGVASGHV